MTTKQELRSKYAKLRQAAYHSQMADINRAQQAEYLEAFRALATPAMVLALIDDLSAASVGVHATPPAPPRPFQRWPRLPPWRS